MFNYTEFYSAQLYSGPSVVNGSRVNVFVTAFRGVYTYPVSFADGKVTITSDLVVGGGTVNAKVPNLAGVSATGQRD